MKRGTNIARNPKTEVTEASLKRTDDHKQFTEDLGGSLYTTENFKSENISIKNTSYIATVFFHVVHNL